MIGETDRQTHGQRQRKRQRGRERERQGERDRERERQGEREREVADSHLPRVLASVFVLFCFVLSVAVCDHV